LDPTAFTAADKARLIEEALDTLRGANAIDERDTLTAETWVAWYDATIPTVTELKVLVAAMERELEVRRGQAVLQEGERRGGDQKSEEIKVSQRETLIHAERVTRSQDRQLGRAAPQVRAWIAREATAGRVPTRRGALTVAGIALKSMQKSPRRPMPTESAANRGFQMAAVKRIDRVQRLREFFDRVGDGTQRSEGELRRAAHQFDVDLTKLLWSVPFIPWVMMERDEAGTTFTIDEELRAICEGRAPRPELEGRSIRDFVRTFRAELTRRREENHDAFHKRKWNSELILKREQSRLLDWIEEQLNRLP